MGQTGADVQLSAAAQRLFGYSIECKNLSRFAGYKFFEQAVSNCSSNSNRVLRPVVVIKGNRKEPIVLITLEHFMELVKHGNSQNTDD